MTEIKIDESYAAVGKEFQIAKVRIDGFAANTDRPIVAIVEEGLVYQGWRVDDHGSLDMDYAGPGERVWLTARDILRPWRKEMDHRIAVLERRQNIRDLLGEMDQMLTDLDLPDAQVHLVQVRPGDPIAVALMGIEEVRALHERLADTTRMG